MYIILFLLNNKASIIIIRCECGSLDGGLDDLFSLDCKVGGGWPVLMSLSIILMLETPVDSLNRASVSINYSMSTMMSVKVKKNYTKSIEKVKKECTCYTYN